MKPVSGRQMCKILEAKGWTFSRINGSHHVFKRPGQRIAISVPVHRNEDLKPGTQRDIMRQGGLTEADL